MFRSTASDDGAIMNQVQATHAPHGREIVVDPLINITEQILIQAIACSTGDVHGKGERSEASKKATELDQNDTSMIQKLSRELSSYKRRCAHAKTMELLNALSSYQWHAKVVLVLTGFAINFGEFCYFVQPCPANTLSKSIALLSKLPNVGDRSSFLIKRRLDILNKLVKAALDVAKSMAEVTNLQFYDISEDKIADSSYSVLIPNAAYLIIKSIMTCSWQIASIMSFKQEYISPSRKALELSNLASEVNSIHQKLKEQLDKCYQKIGEEMIRQFLRYSEEDLYKDTIGSNETRVNVGSQRKKHVLLLISDLNNISEEEIQVLEKLYKEQAIVQSDERLYEMVWIPIVEKRRRNYINELKFGKLKSMMPWHSVRYSVIDSLSIIQIKEKLSFTGRPIVLVRDPQGRVTSTNVIHLMWIWGNLAFPFTHEREEDLWSNQIWSLRTIIDPIDATILEWISEDNHICLYGGVNLGWIQKFTKTMTDVVRSANIKLKMVYVGERDAKEDTQKMAAAIAQEKLSYVLPNNSTLWLFWARLESMQYSKLQENKTADNDEFMRELTTLLNYDGDEGWAMIGRGGTVEMARDNGPNILKALELFTVWKDDVELRGFETSLNEYLAKLPSIEPHSLRLIFPVHGSESLSLHIICFECGRIMEKTTIIHCCKQ